jgi:topoisomerase-4 subunit A
MMARWGLTDTQAEAILNMRLRALRRLEEIALRTELEKLGAEATDIEKLLGSDRRQWTALAKEVRATQAEFGGDTDLGRRRTTIGEAPEPLDIPVTALIEREPVTILCSEKDWIRTVKGHNIAVAEQRYKEGDGPRFVVPAETTDRLMIFGSNGRFYTLGVDRLPSGRGQGEPLRLMIDLANEHEIVAMFPYRLGMKILVASGDGRGFIVDGEEVLAQTRAGKQVLSPGKGEKAVVCVPVDGDAAAFVGENRRMLVVDLTEIPEIARGRGVILQRYRMGRLVDAKMFRLADGLSWRQGENRTRTETDLTAWRGPRGGAGRSVPQGFPRSGKFG